MRAGQTAREAAQLLLKAPPGKPVPLALDLDNELYEMEVTPKGRIYAIGRCSICPRMRPTRTTYSGRPHSARVAAERVRWNVEGGLQRRRTGQNNSGISGLAMCGEKGMPAAAVAAMSARIGDGLSTYREGIISAVNEPAGAKGISLGMPAKDALRLMIA